MHDFSFFLCSPNFNVRSAHAPHSNSNKLFRPFYINCSRYSLQITKRFGCLEDEMQTKEKMPLSMSWVCVCIVYRNSLISMTLAMHCSNEYSINIEFLVNKLAMRFSACSRQAENYQHAITQKITLRTTSGADYMTKVLIFCTLFWVEGGFTGGLSALIVSSLASLAQISLAKCDCKEVKIYTSSVCNSLLDCCGFNGNFMNPYMSSNLST